MLEANISLNKVAESVAHTLGLPYDIFLQEKIKFSAIQYRALLIRRDLERNFITRNFLQSLSCLELICVDSAECCNVNTYEKILRTKEQIPVPLRTKDYDSFHSVSTIDIQKRKSFIETTFENLKYRRELKFTSTEPCYVYHNNYVYIFDKPTPNFKYIDIDSVFEDPRQVGNLSDCNGKNCYSDDDIFPMGADQYPALEAYLLETYGKSQRKVDNEEVTINENV